MKLVKFDRFLTEFDMREGANLFFVAFFEFTFDKFSNFTYTVSLTSKEMAMMKRKPDFLFPFNQLY